MISKLLAYRPRPTTVVAYLALFCSLGGTSYAVATGSIGSREIRNNSVRSRDLRNNNIRGKDVRNGALTSADIRDGSVRGADVGRETLGDANIAALENSNGVVKLALGESRTLVERDPFRVVATCEHNPDSANPASLQARVHPEGSEPGTVIAFIGGSTANQPSPIPPGAENDLGVASSGPAPNNGFGALFSAAPSGAMLRLDVAMGVHELGSDCWVVALTNGETTRP